MNGFPPAGIWGVLLSNVWLGMFIFLGEKCSINQGTIITFTYSSHEK